MDKYRSLVFAWCLLGAFLLPRAVKAQFPANAVAGDESRVYYCIDDFRPFQDSSITRCFQEALRASSLFVSASQVTLANKVFYACNTKKCTLWVNLDGQGYNGYIYPTDDIFYHCNYNINTDTKILSGYILLFLRNGEHPTVTGYSTESNTIVPLNCRGPESYDIYAIVFDVTDYTSNPQTANFGFARGWPMVSNGMAAQNVFMITPGMTNSSGSEHLSWGTYEHIPTDGTVIGNNFASWSLIFNNQHTVNHINSVNSPSGVEADMITALIHPESVFDRDTDSGGMTDYREWLLNNHNWIDNPSDDADTTFELPNEKPPLEPAGQVVDIGQDTGYYLEWLIGNPGDGENGGNAGGVPSFIPPAILEGELQGEDISGGDIDADDAKADVEQIFRDEFEDKGWMAAINAMTAETFDAQTMPGELFHPVISVSDFGQTTTMDLGQYDLDVTKFKNIVGADKLNIIRLALKACVVIGFCWAMIRLLMSSVSGAKTDD